MKESPVSLLPASQLPSPLDLAALLGARAPTEYPRSAPWWIPKGVLEAGSCWKSGGLLSNSLRAEDSFPACPTTHRELTDRAANCQKIRGPSGPGSQHSMSSAPSIMESLSLGCHSQVGRSACRSSVISQKQISLNWLCRISFHNLPSFLMNVNFHTNFLNWPPASQFYSLRGINFTSFPTCIYQKWKDLNLKAEELNHPVLQRSEKHLIGVINIWL